MCRLRYFFLLHNLPLLILFVAFFLFFFKFTNCREKLQTATSDEPADVQKLRKELTEATFQLVQKSNELLNCKFDLQRHRLEIDVSVCVCVINFFSSSALIRLFFCFDKYLETESRRLQIEYTL